MHKRISKAIALILLLALTTALMPTAALAAEYDDTLVFVHTNDVHGHIDVEAYIPPLAKELREEYGEDKVLVLSGGDSWSGTTFAGLSSGEYVVPVMNAAGYQAMAIGNGDTLVGPEQLKKLVASSSFPILSANVTDKDGNALADPTVVFDCGGTKVGVVALTTDDLKSNGCVPTDVIEAAEKHIALLKADGCDFIVALTHIGFEDTYTVSSQKLAAEVEGIDLIIDAHSHTVIENGFQGENNTFIVQTGNYGDNIGVTKLHIKDGKVAASECELISKESYTAKYTPDATVKALIDEYNALIDAKTSEVVGEIEYELDGARENVRTKQTNLGSFVADAIRWYTEADIALATAATLRASIPAGEVTLNDILGAVGIGLDTYVATATGAQLREILTKAIAKNPAADAGFQHVSGMSYTYALGESGNVIVDMFFANGEPIKDTDTFKLAFELYVPDNFKVMEIDGLSKSIEGQVEAANVLNSYLNSDDCVIEADAGGRSTEVDYPVSDSPFSDVKDTDWFYDAVVYAKENNLMDGSGNGKFSPNDTVTRAMAVTILYRLEGSPAVENTESFDDVEAGIWYEKAVAWAVANDIVKGDGTGFNPGGTLTREGLMTLFHRYAVKSGADVSATDDLAAFTDVSSISDWALDSVKWAVGSKMVNGLTDTTVAPGGESNRAQLATLMMRFAEFIKSETE